jgi:hypothetical protein
MGNSKKPSVHPCRDLPGCLKRYIKGSPKVVTYIIKQIMQVVKACNSARQYYITNLAKELNENLNPKPFWNYVKSKRKGTNILTSLEVDGRTFIDDLSIAESMNQFFSSVFTSENLDNLPEFDYACDKKLSDIQCSINEVENHLKNLDIYKSPWPDSISPRVLRECASELASPLCTLLNKSFFSRRNLAAGNLLISPHYIKKDARTVGKTIAKFHSHQLSLKLVKRLLKTEY